MEAPTGNPPIRLIKTAERALPGREKSFFPIALAIFPLKRQRRELIKKDESAIKGKSDGITDTAHISRPLRTPSAAFSGISSRRNAIRQLPAAAGMYFKICAVFDFIIFKGAHPVSCKFSYRL